MVSENEVEQVAGPSLFKGAMEEVMSKRTNVFDEFEVRSLRTQWKHKISVIPENVGDGITSRWWNYTSGVLRDGPEAKVPGGESISSKQSGEYNVGDPALAGGAFRVEGLAQNPEDETWSGYTNRLDRPSTEADGAGIGRRYFDAGSGDNGGAKVSGPQDYVWFKSGVDNVPNLIIPRDRWNGKDVGKLPDTALTKLGGFLRIDHTFYNHGKVDINWGVKMGNSIEMFTVHTFVVKSNPMWTQSDLKWQAATLGANLDGYINAAHYKAGESTFTVRGNAEVRDGSVAGGTVNITQGQAVPLISIKLRDGWENLNSELSDFSVEMDNSFYLFLSVNSDLESSNFSPPMSELADISPDATEYGLLSDNEATGFGANGVGEVEFASHVPSSSGPGDGSTSLQGSLGHVGLAKGETATLGIIPIGATAFNGSSLDWSINM